MTYGSDVIIELLKKHDVEYIACNPGATIRGLYDSVINDEKDKALKLISCCHEEIAIAIAHGYTKMSGKIMPVLIHANIGLLHASMAIFNAWCDRVPMLVIGGVGPLAVDHRRPWIDWIHTSQNHGAIIEGYVKWHDQPANLASTVESLRRSFQLTTTSPSAPIYIAIDATIQEAPAKFTQVLEPLKSFSLPQICSEDLDTLTRKLISSQNPLIIVDYMGKNPAAVNVLVELVELLKIPVIDIGNRFNFPNTHSLCLTGMSKKEFKKIDFILALDVHDLSAVLGQTKAEVAHVSMDNFLVSSWVADYHKLYPVDYPISADSAIFLRALLDRCIALNPQINKSREKYWTTLHKKMRKMWLEKAQHLSIPFVLHEIWQAIKNENWVLANEANVSVSQWVKKIWEFNQPGKYIGNSGGAGLGYGLGASIGAALACKNTDKIVINLQGDGDLLFTPSALWTAAHYEVPLLIIVINNRGYGNTHEHAIKIATSRRRKLTHASEGHQITDPAVDFCALANSFGIKTFPPVLNANEIQATLQQALHYIKQKRKPVLIDMVVDRNEN